MAAERNPTEIRSFGSWSPLADTLPSRRKGDDMGTPAQTARHWYQLNSWTGIAHRVDLATVILAARGVGLTRETRGIVTGGRFAYREFIYIRADRLNDGIERAAAKEADRRHEANRKKQSKG